jgi:hypothetical protein
VRSALAWGCVLVLLGGCECAEVPPAPDAGNDAGTDSGIVACNNGGSLTVTASLEPLELTQPGAVLLGAASTPDGFRVSLFRFVADVPSSPPGEHLLLDIDGDGMIRRTTVARVTAADIAYPASATMVVDDSGASVLFGIEHTTDSSTSRIWGVRVEDSDVTVLFARSEDDAGRRLRSPVLTTDGTTVAGWFLRDTSLMRFAVPDVASETLVATDFAARGAHLAGVALEADRVCIAVRDQLSGRLELVVLGSTGVESRIELVGRGALTTPMPVASGGDCTVAFYVPDVAAPERGSVETSALEHDLSGWGAAAPTGVQWLPEGILMTLWAADAEGIGIAWVASGEHDCRPVAQLGPWPVWRPTGPYGDVVGASGAAGAIGVSANLEAPGQVSIYPLVVP